MTCKFASHQGYEYAWVDTCCIDKSSSAELTEAINSMFRWYQRAEICYVFLSDLNKGTVRNLSDCRWFTRGWTLQELIAPCRVQFFDSSWRHCGNRSNMITELARITRIKEGVLGQRVDLSSVCVAEKMS